MKWKNSEGISYIRIPVCGRVDEEGLALLQVVASTTRRKILELVGQGVDHPEDLARKMKLRRQSVDKQLLELYGWGFVDRSAILPVGGRPRIVYRLTDRAVDFLGRVEALANDFREGVRADFQRSLAFLEDKLASGEIDEDAYLKRRQELEARYAPFADKPPKKEESRREGQGRAPR